MMRRLAFATLLALALTACSTTATSYRALPEFPLMRPAAGYQEEARSGGLIKVTYNGDRTMLMYLVENYALYRSAEIAQRERKPYFALYQTLPEALKDQRSSAVKPTTLLGIPHAEVYIRLHGSAAPGLLSTTEVLARLGPSIYRGAN